MSEQCRECRADLQHCHGTVIQHIRFRSECTEAGCETPAAVHTYILDCATIGCLCGQADALTAQAG